jgi:hypothetical protein
MDDGAMLYCASKLAHSIKRLWLLGQARAGMRKKPMEILGLTEEEFELEGKGTFVGDEVKSKGIEVT